MAEVYFSNALNENFLNHLEGKLKETFNGCSEIAIKIHFGEPGNKTAFRPEDIKPITDLIKKIGLNFFMYDSSVNYGGIRGEHESHKKYALDKGFGDLGEVRTGDEYVESKGKYMTYQVCKKLPDADGVLVISHFKGHPCSGFGGAVKNLGMGALTPKSKNDIHRGGEPAFSGECAMCGACVRACPINTLKLGEDRPVFGECWGCSNCAMACPNDCLKPKVAEFDALLADGAGAALRTFKKKYFVSFIKNVTERCDCEADSMEVIAKDVGVVSSSDIVSIDTAARDMIVEKEGKDVFLEANKKTGLRQLEVAEELGMGKADYSLKKL